MKKTLNDYAIVIKEKIVFKHFYEKVFNNINYNYFFIFFKIKKMQISYFWKSVDKFIGRCLCCSQPYHPYNKLNLISQIVESLFIISCLFLYTLFSFYDYFHPLFFRIAGISSLAVFLFGTYLRINSGYFDQGTIVYNRQKIIQKYRTEIMFYDLIGFIGQIYQIITNDNSQKTKVLCFLLILKYKVYLYNMDKIEERLNLTGNMVYFW